MGIFDWLSGKNKAKKQAKEENMAFFAQLPAVEYQFETVEGRRMLAEVAYVLPKDDQEMNRLDFQHHLLRAVLHSNYFAPINQPEAILDVGCGTSRWCYEVAREFPRARVLGCDLIEQDSHSESQPLNYQFIVGDVLKGLPFSSMSFDFVHQRLLTGGMPTAHWTQNIQELFRLTKPGGWVEMVEITSTSVQSGEISELLASGVNAACRQRGIDPAHLPNLPQYMKQAGLMNIKARVVAIPLGNWGGRIGGMMLKNWLTLLTAFKPGILLALDITSEQFDELLKEAQRDWERLHASVPCYILYGQRPQLL